VVKHIILENETRPGAAQKVEEIAEAVTKLPPDQLARFRRWFTAFEAGRQRRFPTRRSPSKNWTPALSCQRVHLVNPPTGRIIGEGN
jgi:hypothetical protein